MVPLKTWIQMLNPCYADKWQDSGIDQAVRSKLTSISVLLIFVGQANFGIAYRCYKQSTYLTVQCFFNVTGWNICSWTADNSISLTFYSLAVALHITRFNVQKFYMVLMLWFMCCVWTSEQTAHFVIRQFSEIGFVHLRRRVFSVQYALSPYVKQTRFIFKGLRGQECARDMQVSSKMLKVIPRTPDVWGLSRN